jgi:integrase
MVGSAARMAEAKTVHTVLSFSIILEGPQMPVLKEALPKYRKHKASGQAVVAIQGQDFYLGPWNSQASHVEYDRIIAEYLAAGRQLPVKRASAADLTIVEILARYKRFAKAYYRKNGKSTGEWENVEHAVQPLLRLYGRTAVQDFGPLALKAVRQTMIKDGLTRQGINARINRIKRVIRWAVSEELAPAMLIQALETVGGLEAGRTSAPETVPVAPVSDEVVGKTLPHLPGVVADMVRFQRLTGCRPGEVCQLRPMDVDRSQEVWQYRPASHKTQHHDMERAIFIGPKAQDILRPYLLRPADTCCFSPAESKKQWLEARHAARKTPLSCGNAPGSNRKSHPKRRPKDRYTKDTYNRAIQRGCEAAFDMPTELRRISTKLPDDERKRLQKLAAKWRAENCWSPNQLRHSAGTQVRREFGLEAAQVILGHAKADVTQVYAERDQALAAEVMGKIG